MAPYRTKGKKNKQRRSCFFPVWGCCFGSFKQKETNILFVDDDHHGDGKSVTSGISKKSNRGGKKTVLISKEILHVVVEQEADTVLMNNKLLVQSPPRSVIVNKDSLPQRNKSLSESGRAAQESRSGPIKLLHSVSLPLLQWKKEKTPAGEKGKELVPAAGELDPMVGALIIMVALVVMLIWGKLCAILCTAIWFYFIIPRFRSNHVVKLDNDLNWR